MLEGWGLLFVEDVGEDLSGDGVGVKAVGQDATVVETPAEAVNLVVGIHSGFVEEGLPLVVGEGLF